MKKFAALTITLATVLAAAGGTTAYAADGETVYPEDSEFIKTLTLTSLTDYAVEDGLYAFADGKTVKVYDNGNYSERAFENDVLHIEIKESAIYCGCNDEKTYTFADGTECEYTFTQTESNNEILYNGYYYFIDVNGMNVFDKQETLTYEGEYSNLKRFGETVYAVKENKLYSFTGNQCEEVVLEYADFSATAEIAVGQASTALKSYSPVKFVTVTEGAYMTAVDLEQLGGEYFVPVKTVKAAENTTALLLCYTGNAAIVSIGDNGYLVSKSKTQDATVEYSTEIPFENAQMLGGNIYASPYVISGTVAFSNATDMKVKVIDRLDCESILNSVFYEVEYTADGKSLKGYVAEGFLSKQIIEDYKDPDHIKDPEYSESNDTKTILIIFAVVLLVLAAIGYISYISANGKGKKKKKSKDKDNED